MIKHSKKKISLPDPYDDDYKAVLAAVVRLPKEEQAKILQRIGVLGSDGKLAPAYADDDASDESPSDAASTKGRRTKRSWPDDRADHQGGGVQVLG
jgi:hypothetical protein